MNILSIINNKGGVGKTVTTVNLAAILAQKGNKVLIIDLDPQANATSHLGTQVNPECTSFEVLNELKANCVYSTKVKNIYIVPGSTSLSENEDELRSKMARELRLRKWINNLDEEYDFILIDCPPTLGLLTINALVASTHVISPIKIDKFAIDGLERLVDIMGEVKDNFNPNLKFLGTFITMDKKTVINRTKKKEINEAIGDLLLKQSIRENVAIPKSTLEELPVVIMDKNANSSKDYINLCEEILTWL